MASPTAQPAEVDVKELQALIASKKKESAILPLIEKLFTCLVDTDKWLFLSELLGHDSKKLSRYAFYFLSSRHGIPQSPLSPASSSKIKEFASSELKSTVPHRVVYALRLLESCTRPNEKDSLLSKTLPELIENLLANQTDVVLAGDKDKKKKASKGAASPTTNMVLAECFMAYRTCFTRLESSTLKSLTKGLNSKDVAVARHASTLLVRMVNAPGANLGAIAKILEPHLGLDNVVVPSMREDMVTPTSQGKTSTVAATAAAEESTMKLHGINRNHEDVRAMWVRICARFAQEENPSVSGISAESRERWLTELCDFLLDESDRVSFVAMEGVISCGWTVVSRLSVTSPHAFITIPVQKALSTRLIASLASTSTPVVHYAARIAKDLAQCYMKYFEAGSVASTSPVSPRRSTSVTAMSGIPISATTAAGPGSTAMMRKGTVTALMGGRGRTWTKTGTPSFDEEHPLKHLKGALQIVFNNHRSSYVRAQVLSTLIWLEYSWDGFEVEELLLKERNAAQPALHDEVFQEFLSRALLSPQLVDVLLRVYYEHFSHAPAKLNVTLLLRAWDAIARLGTTYKAKVVDSIFAFLDHPVKKETRNIIHHIHRVIYWHLGEHGIELANEICAELPKSSTIVNDEPDFPISNPTTRAIIARLELAITSSPWELRVICTESLAKFAFKASYPVRLRTFNFFKLISKADGASLFPVVAPFIQLLDRIFALRRTWAFTCQSGAKLSLANLAQLQSDLEEVRAELMPYVNMEKLNPIGADLDPFLKSASMPTSPTSPTPSTSQSHFPTHPPLEKTPSSSNTKPDRIMEKEKSKKSLKSDSVSDQKSSSSDNLKSKKDEKDKDSASSSKMVKKLSKVSVGDDAPSSSKTKKTRDRSASISIDPKDKDKDKEKKSKKDKDKEKRDSKD
jgi:hypothetical protein